MSILEETQSASPLGSRFDDLSIQDQDLILAQLPPESVVSLAREWSRSEQTD